MPPIKPVPVKICEFCGASLNRKRYGQALEDRSAFIRRRFCDLKCANSKKDPLRSGYLKRARKFLKPSCEKCGSVDNIGIHHKDRDWKNNNPDNLQTLCNVCHTALHWQEDPTFGARCPKRDRCLICDSKTKGHGYCLKHYQRWKKYGDPLLTRKVGGCKSSPVIRVSE